MSSNSPSPEYLCEEPHKQSTGNPAPAKCIITYFSVHFKGIDSFFLIFIFESLCDLSRFGLLAESCGFPVPEKGLTELCYFRWLSFSVCKCNPEYVFLRILRLFFMSAFRPFNFACGQNLKGCVQSCQTQAEGGVSRAFYQETSDSAIAAELPAKGAYPLRFFRPEAFRPKSFRLNLYKKSLQLNNRLQLSAEIRSI